MNEDKYCIHCGHVLIDDTCERCGNVQIIASIKKLLKPFVSEVDFLKIK